MKREDLINAIVDYKINDQPIAKVMAAVDKYSKSLNAAKPDVKRRFEFEGHFIVPDKVTSVSNVIKISTGPYACDWEYGFEVKLIGGKIDITVPTPKDSMGNWLLQKEERIETAYNRRTEFIAGLNGANFVLQNLQQCNVSGRSELLLAFIQAVKDEFKDQNWDYLHFIADRVLASNSH